MQGVAQKEGKFGEFWVPKQFRRIFSILPIPPKTGLVINPKIGIIGESGGSVSFWNRPDTVSEIVMDNIHVSGRQHGLTLGQWGLLLLAFTLGIGSSFVVREVFPPAHASVVQTASLSSGMVK